MRNLKKIIGLAWDVIKTHAAEEDFHPNLWKLRDEDESLIGQEFYLSVYRIVSQTFLPGEFEAGKKLVNESYLAAAPAFKGDEPLPKEEWEKIFNRLRLLDAIIPEMRPSPWRTFLVNILLLTDGAYFERGEFKENEKNIELLVSDKLPA